MIPAANKPEIDICMDPPTIINGILGGIIAPITALEPVTAAEKAAGYLSLIIAGIINGPIEAASASTEPEIPAKNILVTMFTWANPPFIHPTKALATLINFWVRLSLFNSSPVKTNIGSARSAKLSIPPYIWVIKIRGGIRVPEKNIKYVEARPRLKATGTPINKKPKNGRKRYGKTNSIFYNAFRF